MLLATVVIGRVLVEPAMPPPVVFDSALLMVKRRDVMVGCPSGDAGMTGDAAVDSSLGDAGPSDAGIGDAGLGDAGVEDAGIDGDAGAGGGSCTTIDGDAITMVVQPHVTVASDGTRFAVLLVTPARPIVELQPLVFEDLAHRTAPLIEIRRVEVPDPSLGTVCEQAEYGCGGGGGGGGGGCDGEGGYSPWSPPGIGDAGLGDGAVVEETLGPYQFIRAQPTTTAELAGWLDQLGYAHSQQDLDAVAPYIDLGFHVVAIRVAIDEPVSENLTPVALTWAGSELRIPAALGRAAGAGAGPLTVYIAAEQKYIVPDAHVAYARHTTTNGTTFLTRNEIMLDQTLPASADPIAVHVDSFEYQDVEIVTQEVRVPAEVPCRNDHDEERGCCSECNAKPRTRLDLLLVVVAVALVLRRKRRR